MRISQLLESSFTSRPTIISELHCTSPYGQKAIKHAGSRFHRSVKSRERDAGDCVRKKATRRIVIGRGDEMEGRGCRDSR